MSRSIPTRMCYSSIICNIGKWWGSDTTAPHTLDPSSCSEDGLRLTSMAPSKNLSMDSWRFSAKPSGHRWANRMFWKYMKRFWLKKSTNKGTSGGWVFTQQRFCEHPHFLSHSQILWWRRQGTRSEKAVALFDPGAHLVTHSLVKVSKHGTPSFIPAPSHILHTIL